MNRNEILSLVRAQMLAGGTVPTLLSELLAQADCQTKDDEKK